MTYTLDYLRENNLIIFEAKMGSHAYGTSLPTSDTDIRGVFMQPLDDILKYGFTDQVNDDKNDIIFYELGRFMELLEKNNPNILELLNAPEDCIIFRDKVFYQIINSAKKFLSKKCRWTFAGYAIEQIKKAKGYNKKINWEEAEMKRKNVLDFCYIIRGAGTIPFKTWLKIRNEQLTYQGRMQTYKNFSLAKIDHAHDMFAMYEFGGGIISDPETANDVQLRSIPKGLAVEGYLTFNKDAYSSHCKRYKEYQTWLNNRNEDRFKMNKEHGKNYDSKNMMHTLRLLTMAKEIANGDIIVRRPPEEIETLMKVRRGEFEYEDLIRTAENMIHNLDEEFDRSELPKEVDREFVRGILFRMRNMRYFPTINNTE